MVFQLRLIKYIRVCDDRKSMHDVRWNWRGIRRGFSIIYVFQSYYSIFYYNPLTDRTWVTYLTHALFNRKIPRIKSNSHPIDWTLRSTSYFTCATWSNVVVYKSRVQIVGEKSHVFEYSSKFFESIKKYNILRSS